MFDRNESSNDGIPTHAGLPAQNKNTLRGNEAEADGFAGPLGSAGRVQPGREHGGQIRFGDAHMHGVTESGKVASRSIAFPEVIFSRVAMPDMVLDWGREQSCVGRATMVFLLHGNIEINTSSNKILKRRPGVYLIPPENGEIIFKTMAAKNSLIVVSLSPRLFSTILPDYKTFLMMGQDSRLDTASLQPLLAFVVSACNLNNPRPQTVEILESAANDVSRSLLITCFGQGMSVMPLIERVRKYVSENYTDSTLSITKTAEHENVSVRTVQLALQEADTNFTSLVRRARTDAALELRRSQPSLTLVEIGDRCGFGSVSSLRRALKTHEEFENEEHGEE